MVLNPFFFGGLPATIGDPFITSNGYTGDGTDTTADIPLTLLSPGDISVGDTVQSEVYTPETDTITDVASTSLPYRVGYPQPENLGTNNPPSTLIPIGQSIIDNCTFFEYAPGESWDRGSTGSSPGWQTFLIIDQGTSIIPTIPLSTNLTGASYSLFVSETGGLNSWTWAGTILPSSDPIVGTLAGRYVLFVRNANGDSTGVTTNGETPAMQNEPLYFTTPTVTGGTAVTLTFTTDQDIKLFQAGDTVQAGVDVISTDVAASTITVNGGSWVSGNRVTTASPKQGTGTVKSITDNNLVVSPWTDNSFKEGQLLTKI